MVLSGNSISGAEPKSPDPNFFPLAVWLQSPNNVPKFKELGINVYVGLWRGPNAEQLATLKQHGLRVICDQNETALGHLDDATIFAWMHGDEPDNAQSLPDRKGYGPPILPAKIISNYERIKQRDPSRPVLLNLGQGVAWDRYIGRGTRTNHPEDYAEYVKGCDIASFDIYPAVHTHPDVAGKLWFVADGVRRLRKWAGDDKPVWNCIECTHIDNAKVKPTPQQVRAEIWMSIIRGSQGLIYFVHQFKPTFVEAGLLNDSEMCTQIRDINNQITRLAPVLNSPTITDAVTIKTSENTPVEAICKRVDGKLYIFSVAMRGEPGEATFQINGQTDPVELEVLGEDRTIRAANGQFHDSFSGWAVHLYRMK